TCTKNLIYSECIKLKVYLMQHLRECPNMRGKLKKTARFLLLSIVILLTACSGNGATGETEDEDQGESEQIKVLTTIAQIGEPLSVIGEDRLEVESLMGPAIDPHVYQATQSDMNKIDEAELIFYTGLNLEANMTEIFENLKETKPVLAIGEQIPEESLLKEENGATDPHIWFDIDLWKEA